MILESGICSFWEYISDKTFIVDFFFQILMLNIHYLKLMLEKYEHLRIKCKSVYRHLNCQF